jgi:copper chaperone CopZ
MEGAAFLKPQTLLVLGLGFIAICLDTVTGVLFGKLMCFFTRGKINPLIGAAGISAYPMSARVVQSVGRKYDDNNWLLMHAIGANTGGQIGSVMAAAIMLSVLKVKGMNCQHCVMSVTKALGQLEGIKNVQVDLAFCALGRRLGREAGPIAQVGRQQLHRGILAVADHGVHDQAGQVAVEVDALANHLDLRLTAFSRGC